MKYFLLKDYNDGEPYEMLMFKSDVDKNEVQKTIWDSSDYYYEHEDEILNSDDYGVSCQGEWNLYCLSEKYDFEIVPWSNDDNLYY